MSDTKISALTAAALPVSGALETVLADGSGAVNYRTPAWSLGAWYALTTEASGAAGVEFELPDEPYVIQLMWSNVKWTSTSSSIFGFDVWFWGAGAYDTTNFEGGVRRLEEGGATNGAPLTASPVFQTTRYASTFNNSSYPFSGEARLDGIAASQPCVFSGTSVEYELFSGQYYVNRTIFVGTKPNPSPTSYNRVRKIRFRRADSANITGTFGVRRIV